MNVMVGHVFCAQPRAELRKMRLHLCKPCGPLPMNGSGNIIPRTPAFSCGSPTVTQSFHRFSGWSPDQTGHYDAKCAGCLSPSNPSTLFIPGGRALRNVGCWKEERCAAMSAVLMPTCDSRRARNRAAPHHSRAHERISTRGCEAVLKATPSSWR